jgi:hypothetical protein
MKKTHSRLFVLWRFLGVLSLIAVTSCGQRMARTPSEYKYKVLTSSKEYSEDSIYLYFVLETMLTKNITPFTPGSLFTKSTSLYVDSTLYSPNKLRLIVLVISKVTNKEKKPGVGGQIPNDYIGNYLFCTRDSLSAPIKIFNYGPYRLITDSYGETKQALQELCFGRRATQQWSKGISFQNMDDIRFWNSDEFNSVISKNRFIQMQD